MTLDTIKPTGVNPDVVQGMYTSWDGEETNTFVNLADGVSERSPVLIYQLDNEFQAQNSAMQNYVDGADAKTLNLAKSYADAVRNGLRPKPAVRGVFTSNITLSGLQNTSDGQPGAEGMPVLVMGQTDPKTNGFYIEAAGAWSRAHWAADTATLQPGSMTIVDNNGPLDNHEFVLTTIPNADNLIDVGNVPLTFEDYTTDLALAGNALAYTSNPDGSRTLSVLPTPGETLINPKTNSIGIDPAYAQTLLAEAASDAAAAPKDASTITNLQNAIVAAASTLLKGRQLRVNLGNASSQFNNTNHQFIINHSFNDVNIDSWRLKNVTLNRFNDTPQVQAVSPSQITVTFGTKTPVTPSDWELTVLFEFV